MHASPAPPRRVALGPLVYVSKTLFPSSGRTKWPLMGGQVSASGNFQSCGINADWMSALCPLLWDVPLHHLSIPGEGFCVPQGRGRPWGGA